jgi:hypothetical protein
MNATRHVDGLLDKAHDVARSEDGLFFVDRDGTITMWRDGWRAAKHTGAKVLVDLTGSEPPSTVPVVCPSNAPIGVSDLGLATRVDVSRSVEYDPDLPDGSRPTEQVKVAEDVAAVARFGPIQPVTLTGLPHKTDARSQQLADRWVDRLSGEPGVLADITFPLSKRPQDAMPLLGCRWGSMLWVAGTVQGLREVTNCELVGMDHTVVADSHWTMTIHVDRWAGDVPNALPTGAFDGAFKNRQYDTAAI